MPAQILTIQYSPSAAIGGGRTLSPADKFGYTWTKGWTIRLRAVVNCAAGPDWILGHGVDPGQILDSLAVAFPSLGSGWGTWPGFRGFYEPDPDPETICIGQNIVSGPNQGIVTGGNGVDYSGCIYEVDFEFQTFQGPSLEVAPIDQPSPDPIDWLPYTTFNPLEVERTVEHGTFLGGYTQAEVDYCSCPGDPVPTLVAVDNTALTLAIGDCAKISNSVGDKFENFVTNSKYMREMTTHKFRSYYYPDQFKCFEGTVNQVPFQIRHPHLNFHVIFQPYTVLLQTVDGTPAVRVFRSQGGSIVNRSYWEWKYRMIYNPQGWYDDHDNSGFNRAHNIFVDPPLQSDEKLVPILEWVNQAPPGPLPPGVVGVGPGYWRKRQIPRQLRLEGDLLVLGLDDPAYMRWLKYPQSDFNEPSLDLVTLL